MLWSRPENKAFAGKLLIVGGNAHGFAAPAGAYATAGRAGIGTARVLLPDSLRRTVGRVFEAGEFAPSTPSGSFSQKALAELLDMARWADAVLLAGDFGRNSETAILLEKFVNKYGGQTSLAGDASDYFLALPQPVIDRPDSLLALNFGQLQKLATGAHFTEAFTSQLDLLHFVTTLRGFSQQHQAHLLVHHLDHIFVAVQGIISSTPLKTTGDILNSASHAAVWWLQNPDKPFESITTGLVVAG